MIEASRGGRLARVETRHLGELLGSAGGGRPTPDAEIDYEVALHVESRLGDEVTAGDELARLYLRKRDEGLISAFRACFVVSDEGEAPEMIRGRVG